MSVNPNIPPPSGFGPLLMQWLTENTLLNKRRINALTNIIVSGGGGGGGGLTNPLTVALDMGGNEINNLVMDPSPQPLDAVNLAFVQAFVAGLSWKQAVRAATTAPLAAHTYANGASGVGATITITAVGTLTLDTVLLALNDRALIKNEGVSNSSIENGLYIVTQTGAGVQTILTRTTDADLDGELVSATCSVTEGSVNVGKVFTQTTASPITVGVTLLVFQKTFDTVVSGSPSINVVGNVISLNVANSNIWTALQTFNSSIVTTAWNPTSPDLNVPVARATVGNANAATAALGQASASLVLQSNGWKSAATAASVSTEWRLINNPLQGVNNPTTKLYFVPTVAGVFTGLNNGAQTFFDHKGNMTVNGVYIGQPPLQVTSNTNIAIGTGSPLANATVAGNVALGNSAGIGVVNGVSNTLIGNNAGPTAGLSGGENICLGSRSGNLLTSGAASNIIISSGNGQGAATISTGSNNILLGNFLIPVGLRTINNQIFISDGQGSLRLFVATTTGNMILGGGTVDDGNNLLQVPGSVATTGIVHAISTKVANYTLTKNDHTILADPTAGAITLTLPIGGITVGQIFNMKRTTAAGNALTIIVSGGVILIDGTASVSLAAQYDKLTVQWNGVQYFIL